MSLDVLLHVILGIALGLVGWLGKRVFARYDSDIEKLTERVEHLENALLRRAAHGK